MGYRGKLGGEGAKGVEGIDPTEHAQDINHKSYRIKIKTENSKLQTPKKKKKTRELIVKEKTHSFGYWLPEHPPTPSGSLYRDRHLKNTACSPYNTPFSLRHSRDFHFKLNAPYLGSSITFLFFSSVSGFWLLSSGFCLLFLPLLHFISFQTHFLSDRLDSFHFHDDDDNNLS